MKAKVYCFGHGWAIELPGKTHYVGAWHEVWPLFDEVNAHIQITAWLDIYRARMGTEAQTKGMA
jgi:hypothetical protein